ncbi:MAG: signal peptidase I, partial [Romboutsia timonensis]
MSEKFKKELIEWIKVIATALVFAFIITQFIRPTLVRGKSMYPTLVENDYLIINRMAYKIGEPKDGDIIVFKT